MNKTEKYCKAVRGLLMRCGAIEMTTAPYWPGHAPLYTGDAALGMKCTEENAFIMETVAGLLWLKLDLAPSKLYTVFGRFDNVDQANKELGTGGRLNNSSGKYNFHYSKLDELLQSLDHELKILMPKNRTVITKYDDLCNLGYESFDAEKIIFVYDGQFCTNTRLDILHGKDWLRNNYKNKIVVLVDGVSGVLSKSTKFQLIYDGELRPY